MRQLLYRLQTTGYGLRAIGYSRSAKPVARGLTGQHWRRVPNINLLPSRRRAPGKTLMVRGLLVLILLVAAFQVQARYRDKAAAAHGIETTKTRLQAIQREKTTVEEAIQREVTPVQQELEPLRTQMSQLQQQREARKQANQVYQGITSGLERWHSALPALFGPEAPGVRFESVTTQAGGEVVIKGVVTEREAVAKLQTQFRDMASTLDLQGIEWKAGSAAFTFTAAFKVRR